MNEQSGTTRTASETVPGTDEVEPDATFRALTRLSTQLEAMAAGRPTESDARALVDEIAALLPDGRAADLLDEIVTAQCPPNLRARAAFHLVRQGLLDTASSESHALLAEVGPPARLAMARGLHDRGSHDLARGLLAPLTRAVHPDVRLEAQLWYRYSRAEYDDMSMVDLVRDATREPGWLHRSWAAQELFERGEIEQMLVALEGVVGLWGRVREDGAGKQEPFEIIDLLTRLSDHPAARTLLRVAAGDSDAQIAGAARAVLGDADRIIVDLSAAERREARGRESASAGKRRRFTLRR